MKYRVFGTYKYFESGTFDTEAEDEDKAIEMAKDHFDLTLLEPELLSREWETAVLDEDDEITYLNEAFKEEVG